MKTLENIYTGDQVWLRNYSRGEKWIKGTIISKVKCFDEIYEKHIDQLRFYPDIETN